MRIHKTRTRRGPNTYRLRPDGLLVPHTGKKPSLRLPWRGMLAGLVAAMTVKVAMIVALGPDLYEARITTLLDGSAYQETATAVLMPDPVSSFTATQVAQQLARLGR